LNDQFSVQVNETGAKNLYSTVFVVKYDPKILEVQTKSEGPFMKQNEVPTNFQAFADTKKGELWISLSRVDGEGASGNGVLATVTFKAIGKGAAAIGLANTNFTNKASESFIVTPFNTVVEVK